MTFMMANMCSPPRIVRVFLLIVLSVTIVIFITIQARVLHNIKLQGHFSLDPVTFQTQYSGTDKKSSVETNDKVKIAIGIDRLLRGEEITNRANLMPPVIANKIELNLQSIIDDVSFQDNRVLYKFYRATQDPAYECIIRVLKFRTAPSSDKLDHDKWTQHRCSSNVDFPCSVETKYSLNLDDFWDADVAMLIEGQFFRFSNWSRLAMARPPGQLWVLYTKESPVHEPDFTPPRNIVDDYDGNPYNLTMTFRSDSDFVISYGHFEPTDQTWAPPPPGTFASKKTKLIMWMASRCRPLGWERTKFVKELQKHIPVDVYGRCGSLDCPKHDQNACLTLRKQYKFYLALENSECDEYITEKLWINAYSTGLVPIVYGAPRKDYVRIAPPNSFIHLGDFTSMQEFVEYISLLDRNDTLYEKYFHWKRLGKNVGANGFVNSTNLPNLCVIAQKLVEISLYPGRSWRARNPSFATWWTDSCQHRDELLGIRI